MNEIVFKSQTSVNCHFFKAFKTFDLLNFISAKMYISEMLFKTKNMDNEYVQPNLNSTYILTYKCH